MFFGFYFINYYNRIYFIVSRVNGDIKVRGI